MEERRRPTLRGLFNILPVFDGKFSVCSWNTRTLCHSDKKLRWAKVLQILDLCKRCQFVALLEVHGTLEALQTVLGPCLKSHELVFHSGCENKEGNLKEDSGGIALLVARGVLGKCMSEPSSLVISPGRLGRIEVSIEGHSFCLYPTHNFDISHSQMNNLEKVIQVDIREAKASPSAKSVLLLGDFNIEPIGYKRHFIPKPSENGECELGRGSRLPAASKRWQRIFDELVEISDGGPTHFYSPQSFVNKIDRIFTSVPATAMGLLSQNFGTIKDPMILYTKELSDHSPIYWVVSTKPSKPKDQQKFKPEWARHPLFKESYEKIIGDAELDSLDLGEKNACIKQVMRVAATQVRDLLFEIDPHSNSSRLLRISSISRAVFTKDANLANILLKHSQEARTHMEIDGDGLPAIKDHIHFAEVARLAYEEHFKKRETQIKEERFVKSSEFNNTKKMNKLQANSRMSQLWNEKAPCLQLAGLKITGEEAQEAGVTGTPTDQGQVLITDSGERLTVLKQAWGKTFAVEGEMPSEEAETFVEEYCNEIKWDWSECRPPTSDTIICYLILLSNSAPGRDGIPNAAWKALASCSCIVSHIWTLLVTFLAGGVLPPNFNHGLFVFIPKAVGAMIEAIFCHPSELRPLTLKNTDNKIIAGILNWCIHPIIVKTACSLQRGFVAGRQLVQNPVDLDFYARVDALKFSAGPHHKLQFMSDLSIKKLGLVSTIPIMLLFDFAAAFPSVRHKWLMFILLKIKLPRGLRNALKLMYTDNEAYVESNGELMWLFSVLAGVLQGCPLSGSLFVICIDPLLFLFKKKVEDQGLGRVRACADDIGASLRNLKSIRVFCEIFTLFEKVSGLVLKPKKCVIILTSNVASSHNSRVIKAYLDSHCPSWSHFQVANNGKYLGFIMGPTPGVLQWRGPLSKFKSRVADIRSCGTPLGMIGPSFASRAVSVLGYVGQLVPVPKNFKMAELYAAHKVLGMPLALDVEAVFNLEKFGGVKLVRVSNYLKAAMLRAQCKTVKGASLMHSDLCKEYEGCVLSQLPSGDMRPPGWTEPAFCTSLHRASLGLGLGFDSRANEIAALAQTLTAPGGRPSRKSTQAAFYDLLQSFSQCDWNITLKRKLAFISESVSDASSSDVPSPLHGWCFSGSLESQVCGLVKNLGVRGSIAVIKTWANAWTTSSRMHESKVLQCIFGCEATDCLDHYLCCDPLWTAVISASFKRSELLWQSPLTKLGLERPSIEWLQMCAVAFACYHSIKMSHLNDVLQALESGNHCQVHLRLMNYASVHFKEMFKK